MVGLYSNRRKEKLPELCAAPSTDTEVLLTSSEVSQGFTPNIAGTIGYVDPDTADVVHVDTTAEEHENWMWALMNTLRASAINEKL